MEVLRVIYSWGLIHKDDIYHLLYDLGNILEKKIEWNSDPKDKKNDFEMLSSENYPINVFMNSQELSLATMGLRNILSINSQS